MARTYYRDYVYHPTITRCDQEYPEVKVKEYRLDQVDLLGVIILVIFFLLLRKYVR